MAEPSRGKRQWPDFAIEPVGRVPRPGRLERIRRATTEYPVGGVSWYEAAAYAKFAGKSLPTVYHWVRAAGTRIATLHHAVQQHLREWHHCGRRSAGRVSVRCVRHGRQRPRVGLERDDRPAPAAMFSAEHGQTPCIPFSTPKPARLSTVPMRTVSVSRSISIPSHCHDGADRADSTSCARLYERATCIRRGFSRIREPLYHRSGTARSEGGIDRLERGGLDQREGQLHSRRTVANGYPRTCSCRRNVRPPYQTVVYFPGADAETSRKRARFSRLTCSISSC